VTKVKAAEAEAEARFLQGQGISRQRQAILNGLRESVADFSGKLQMQLADPLVSYPVVPLACPVADLLLRISIFLIGYEAN
jgi:hypothetical protein